MKAFIPITILLFGFAIQSFSQQKNVIALRSGYGWYNMSDLRELQKQFYTEVNIPLEITDDFPPYLIFELNYRHEFKNFFVGGFAGYKSTGARLHYADYSGELFVNQELLAYSLGVNIGTFAVRNEKFSIPMTLSCGVNLTSLEIVSGQTIFDQSDEQRIKLNSTGILIEPQIGYWHYFSRFGVGVDAGYEFNIPGKLYFDEERWLADSDNEPVKAQWNGFRLRLGMSFSFQSLL
jgi:hypothetical protein